MKIFIAQDMLNMIYDRNLIENLKWEASSRAKILECTVYVYYHFNWCSAIVTTEYKGKENLLFKVENNT